MSRITVICSFGGMWSMAESMHGILESEGSHDVQLGPVEGWHELEILLRSCRGKVNHIFAVCAGGVYDEPIQLIQHVESGKLPDAHILFFCEDADGMERQIELRDISSTHYCVLPMRFVLLGNPKKYEFNSHVFMSYIPKNEGTAEQLRQALTIRGIGVWFGRKWVPPGFLTKQEIRRVIRQVEFFLACFSKEYNNMERTYMNEELTLAIEELRKRPTDRAWFIPVLLSKCEIPDRDIGGGQTLRDLQPVNLYENWGIGIQSILSVIQPADPEINA